MSTIDLHTVSIGEQLTHLDNWKYISVTDYSELSSTDVPLLHASVDKLLDDERKTRSLDLHYKQNVPFLYRIVYDLFQEPEKSGST